MPCRLARAGTGSPSPTATSADAEASPRTRTSVAVPCPRVRRTFVQARPLTRQPSGISQGFYPERVRGLAQKAREPRRGKHLIRGPGAAAGAVGDAFGQAGVEAARADVGIVEQFAQERDVRGHPEHGGAGERAVETAQRGGPVRAPGDHLGEHRVVAAADGRALGEARVDADVFPGRLAQRQHGPAGRQEAARRVLGVDAGLDGVAVHAIGRAAVSSSPAATRSCHSTRSSPYTSSVTGCSTWRRVFISMK